jgi:hypothetical protein
MVRRHTHDLSPGARRASGALGSPVFLPTSLPRRCSGPLLRTRTSTQPAENNMRDCAIDQHSGTVAQPGHSLRFDVKFVNQKSQQLGVRRQTNWERLPLKHSSNSHQTSTGHGWPLAANTHRHKSHPCASFFFFFFVRNTVIFAYLASGALTTFLVTSTLQQPAIVATLSSTVYNKLLAPAPGHLLPFATDRA